MGESILVSVLGEGVLWSKKTRKFVEISCPNCSYYRGTKDEKGHVWCAQCGHRILI